MRVLLITITDELAGKLAVLNPELEYCAVVTNEVESAKEILASVGLSQVPIYSMRQLETCVKNSDYDYVLRVQSKVYGEKILDRLLKYGVPANKILSFASLTSRLNFNVKRTLSYYKEHSQDFEMFATGISTACMGINPRFFKRKLFNFAKPSQDLYYDFKVAKFAVLCGGGHI